MTHNTVGLLAHLCTLIPNRDVTTFKFSRIFLRMSYPAWFTLRVMGSLPEGIEIWFPIR